MGFAAGCSLALASEANRSRSEDASTVMEKEPLEFFINHIATRRETLSSFASLVNYITGRTPYCSAATPTQPAEASVEQTVPA